MNIPPRHLKPIQKIDREQRDFLYARVRELRELPRFTERAWRNRQSAMTKAERFARRVIEAFEKRMRREDERKLRARKKIESAIEREMLFGSMTKALAILDKELKK